MKIGRNDLCPCGSGLKYKKCCLAKDEAAKAAAATQVAAAVAQQSTGAAKSRTRGGEATQGPKVLVRTKTSPVRRRAV